MKIKACFLDRDGILIEDTGYPHKWHKNLILRDNIMQLQRLIKHDFKFIVVTNQSGIGRGLFSHSQYFSFNKKMTSYLHSIDFPLQHVYHCPHAPEEDCKCRKPKPGMLVRAFNEYNINKESSILIGDKITDVQCAHNFGLKNAYLLDSSIQSTENYFAKSSMRTICESILKSIA